MKKAFRYAQFLANIATIIIAVFFGLFVIKSFVADSSVPPRIPATAAPGTSAQSPVPKTTPVGQAVPLENIDWAKNQKTLVLYVSTKCRFCTESGPFYQRLVQENALKNVKFVAVMPQPVEEGREYLTKLGVKIDEVYQTPLQSIGVRSTPTLLLVNDSGVVTDSWVGKLQPEREDQVISKLGS
ncbi:MAG: redoxin family protein [Pyrinomonadaceae bacterium]